MAAARRRPIVNTAAAKAARKFTRYVAPTRPPPGYYDPTIDQQERAAGRGLQDVTQDTATGTERADSDYALGNSALDTAAAREGQDYGTNVAAMMRRYRIQGDAQRQSGNAAGLLGGGFLQAAAAKRAENQGIDQTALDTAHARAGEDITRQRSELGLGYARGGEDRTTALSRAGRENTFFGQDANELRAYQAAQAGYVPPPKPAGEGHRGDLVYRRGQQGNVTLESGQRLTPAQFRALIRKRQAQGLAV